MKPSVVKSTWAGTWIGPNYTKKFPFDKTSSLRWSQWKCVPLLLRNPLETNAPPFEYRHASVHIPHTGPVKESSANLRLNISTSQSLLGPLVRGRVYIHFGARNRRRFIIRGILRCLREKARVNSQVTASGQEAGRSWFKATFARSGEKLADGDE